MLTFKLLSSFYHCIKVYLCIIDFSSITGLLFNAYKTLIDFSIYCTFPETFVQVSVEAVAIYISLKVLLLRKLDQNSNPDILQKDFVCTQKELGALKMNMVRSQKSVVYTRAFILIQYSEKVNALINYSKDLKFSAL